VSLASACGSPWSTKILSQYFLSLEVGCAFDVQNAQKILELMDEEEEHLVNGINELNSQQEQAQKVVYVTIATYVA